MSTLVERSKAEAPEVHLGRALATAFLAIFWAIGWVVAKVVNAVVYLFGAVRVGWRDGRTKVNSRGPGR